MQRFTFLKTYRQHNYALLGLFLILMLLAYCINIRSMLHSYKLYKSQQQKLSRVRNASQDITQLRTHLKTLQKTLQRPYDREYLLEELTTFCREHNMLIKNFPIAQKVTEKNYPIITNEVDVQGDYLNIVSLAHMIEQEKKLATISSLSFCLVKDRAKQQQFLHGRLVLRNVEAQPKYN
jgi:Tfp pilus assembly protein PilO